MTVSRVINGVPGRKYSEATAERVRKAIERLGYEPNQVARSLRGRQSGVIGLVTTSVVDPFWASCARGVELEARERNYVPILVASDEDCSLEERQVAALQGRRVDGLLLAATPRLHRTTLTARLANIPTVALDRPIAGFNTDCVMINNEAASAEATRHLIQHGHRRIAFVGYHSRIYTVQKRIIGYAAAMNEAGLESVVRTIGTSAAPVYEMVHEMLSSRNRPTGIFANNTITMQRVIQAARDLGLAIPGDLAVTGFEDFAWAGLVEPGLTVVHQPGEEMGRRAAQLLFERLGGKKGAPQRVILESKLIVRESCGCMKRTAVTAVSA